jgi:hypothetical protein
MSAVAFPGQTPGGQARVQVGVGGRDGLQHLKDVQVQGQRLPGTRLQLYTEPVPQFRPRPLVGGQQDLEPGGSIDRVFGAQNSGGGGAVPGGRHGGGLLNCYRCLAFQAESDLVPDERVLPDQPSGCHRSTRIGTGFGTDAGSNSGRDRNPRLVGDRLVDHRFTVQCRGPGGHQMFVCQGTVCSHVAVGHSTVNSRADSDLSGPVFGFNGDF